MTTELKNVRNNKKIEWTANVTLPYNVYSLNYSSIIFGGEGGVGFIFASIVHIVIDSLSLFSQTRKRQYTGKFCSLVWPGGSSEAHLNRSWREHSQRQVFFNNAEELRKRTTKGVSNYGISCWRRTTWNYAATGRHTMVIMWIVHKTVHLC